MERQKERIARKNRFVCGRLKGERNTDRDKERERRRDEM